MLSCADIVRKRVCVSLLVLFVGAGWCFAEAESAAENDRYLRVLSRARADIEMVDLDSLTLAVRNLMKSFPQKYDGGDGYLKQIADYQSRLGVIKASLKRGDVDAIKDVDGMIQLQRMAMLSNPLIDFDKLLMIKRKPLGDPRRATGREENDKSLGEFLGIPRQSSWQIDEIPDKDTWDNEIVTLSPVSPAGEITTFYKPREPNLISDIELHYDADRLMFSMPGDNGCFQVFEIGADGQSLRQITSGSQPDVHNFDSCYLPNEKIVFLSTAVLQGVPCNATVDVALTYLMDADGENIRQLCFDQDHNYCPTVTNDGRVLYLRWEYTDIPHVWARYLFTMNPDGTGQREYYGSGSYWPNAVFYARAVPDHPTKVVGVVTGHHVGRVGELVVFDPAMGRQESNGVVKRIGDKTDKVLPLIEDKLTLGSWPKFLQPYPLSEKYFIVSAKPRPGDLWGIYLVDVFDNITLIKEAEGYALLEPIPFKRQQRPPVIADRVDLERQDAIMYLEDVYQGAGLKDVPPGTVKNLRLYTYHFAYQNMAGINHRVGVDGPWEPKRVLGTVPVESDGSAMFRVPANTPISIQPLDSQGKALQLMRSWTTAMPGEMVSCVGCHEKQNTTPVNTRTIAAAKDPEEIKPWHGPVRGFSFEREVQPVLDKYCVSCHDGSAAASDAPMPDFSDDGSRFAVLKGQKPEVEYITSSDEQSLLKKYAGVFDASYIELRKYIRVGGFESDIKMLAPCEFHADTSELFQLLNKGHHGVKLDADAVERLAVWIDLNGPCHGTWSQTAGGHMTERDRLRRKELRQRYAKLYDDGEDFYAGVEATIKPVIYDEVDMPVVKPVVCDEWPLTTEQAKARQRLAGSAERTVDLGGGVRLDLVLVPAGKFVMGQADSSADELPLSVVEIDKPYWAGKFEVTNEQYALFDGEHESRFEHKGSWVFSEKHLGWPLDGAKQPVVRISQRQANAFCKWLGDRLGEQVDLPTEAQWEYACRAGTGGKFSEGEDDNIFVNFANMADVTTRQLAYDTDGRFTADITPRDDRFDDGSLVTADVGTYKPNACGLYDMHGNVCEWTRSSYQAYPYEDDGRNGPGYDTRKVVRGGSWRDRPYRCTSGYRLSYPAWQKVFNVGFRVVIEADDARMVAGKIVNN